MERMVNHTFSLDQVNEAYDQLRAGHMSGRGVIDMSCDP